MGDEQDKRRKTLEKWMSKFAFKATYKNLIQALLDSGRGDHAEEVCKLLEKGILWQIDVNKLYRYYCPWYV